LKLHLSIQKGIYALCTDIPLECGAGTRDGSSPSAVNANVEASCFMSHDKVKQNFPHTIQV
jgi:hypothetical protein